MISEKASSSLVGTLNSRCLLPWKGTKRLNISWERIFLESSPNKLTYTAQIVLIITNRCIWSKRQFCKPRQKRTRTFLKSSPWLILKLARRRDIVKFIRNSSLEGKIMGIMRQIFWRCPGASIISRFWSTGIDGGEKALLCIVLQKIFCYVRYQIHLKLSKGALVTFDIIFIRSC